MKRLATPAWLLRHVLMVALVVVFLKLGWWQLSRAEGGNGLSIGYTLEWPAFAAFVVIVWLREVRLTLRPAPSHQHADPTDLDAATDPNGTRAANADETAPASPPVPEMSRISAFDVHAARAARAARTEQGETGAEGSEYNRYLAWLSAHPDAKPSDYRRAVDEGVRTI